LHEKIGGERRCKIASPLSLKASVTTEGSEMDGRAREKEEEMAARVEEGELQRLRDLAGRTRGCRQGRRRRPQIEQLAVKAGGAEEEQVGAVGVRIG
jgi:hypothetical protein